MWYFFTVVLEGASQISSHIGQRDINETVWEQKHVLRFKFMFEWYQFCELYAWLFLYLSFEYFIDNWRWDTLWAMPPHSHECNRTHLFLSTSLPQFMPLKVEHGSVIFFIFFIFLNTHPKFSSCSVRSANKPQWGRGIYFANISIKWSVKVRLGGRQGWEKRGSCLAVGREL